METIPTEEAFRKALEEGTHERVLALLEQGADAAANIDFGRARQTPLAYCIKNNRADIAALLLDHGAPLKGPEAGAYRMALLRTEDTQSTLPLLQILLEKGLNPATELRIRLIDGSIILRPLLLEIARFGTAQHLELLCRFGADLTLTDQIGVNVLMAAFRGSKRRTDSEKIDFIEKQGLNLWHATTLNKNKNLYAYVHDEAGIRLLSEHGVDYNHVDATGLTPLVCAALRQNAAGAELLMRKGALVAPKEASMKERERLFRLFLGLHDPYLGRRARGRGAAYSVQPLNKELLTLLFGQTLDVEERRRICNLALVAACAQKQRELVDYCLREGADINTHTDGLSLLGFVLAQPASRQAGYERNQQAEQDLIAYLLEKGADTNCRDFGVQPVLQTALDAEASAEVIKLLLAHGAEKSQAIISAIRGGKNELAGLLLADGPVDKDLLYKAFWGNDERGRFFFIGRRRYSRMWGELRKQGLIELTENDTDALGVPLISVLKERKVPDPLLVAESSGDKPALQRTEEAETIFMSEEEREAVVQHISSGDADFIRDMLKKHPGFATAEPMQQGDDRHYVSRSALVVAAAAARPEICRLLVESCGDERGIGIRRILRFALHRLCSAEDSPAKTETLKILLEFAQKQQLEIDSYLFGSFSFDGSWSDEQVSLFLEYGSGAPAAHLHHALSKGLHRLARQLVRLGCSLEACSDNGYTCLHSACCGGNPDCVRLCIEAGADVHSTIETAQGDKMTPMALYWKSIEDKEILPVKKKVLEVLEALLQHGVSPDWMDASGTTLLMHAIRTLHSAEIVKMLLQHGADVHLRDREGNTPLMLAVLEKQEEICRLLTEAGASPEDRNNAGCTAMDFARLMQEEESAAEAGET